MTSSAREARAMTKLLLFEGKELQLNAAIEGQVRIGLLDSDGKALPGLSAKECDPITGDSLTHTVTWNGKKNIKKHSDKPIRMRLDIENAKIFSFQFL